MPRQAALLAVRMSLSKWASLFPMPACSRALLRAAEVDCVKTPGGHYALGDTAHLRPLITMTSERIVNIFEHVTTSAPVFTATVEDFDVPELRPLLDVYLAAARAPMPIVSAQAVPARLGDLAMRLIRRASAALRTVAFGLSGGARQCRLSALR